MIGLTILDWLLEIDNPGVRVRTLTGFCGLPEGHPDVKQAHQSAHHALDAAHDLSWMTLIHYFLKRRLFYRMDQPDQLVLNQPGRRMTEVFFPQEYFHVGLPVLLEALTALGAGEAVELENAWRVLERKKDKQGRIPLEGSLPGNKAYLPRERIGKPSKWGTLYAYLAWKNHSGFPIS